jgi:hypothetical protein
MKDRFDEMTQAAAQSAKDLATMAQEKVTDGTGVARGALERLSALGAVSAEAVKTITDDLNELLPAIGKAGYRVQGLDVDLTIPPHVAVHCRLEAEVADADRDALLASLDGRRLAASAIRALFQVADIQARLAAGALTPTDVILDLGVSPGVKVRYREGPARVV